MKKLFLFSITVAFFLIVAYAKAESIQNITFPVTELGNCASETDCRTYCDVESHWDACSAFAQKYNISTTEYNISIAASGEVTFANITELGGCSTESACRTYCDNPGNLGACLNYAEKHNMMPEDKIQEARKVLPFLENNQTPGGCRTESDCMVYCNDPSHANECINFAEQAGFMSKQDADIALKFVSLTGGIGPGGCKLSECKDYCENPSHMKECVDLGHELGLVNDSDYQIAKKFAAMGGTGPRGCKGIECKAYCEDPKHLSDCVDFGHELGVISDADYPVAKKFAELGGVGPGGCTTKTGCESYCQANMHNSHFSECIDFAHKLGLISDSDYQNAKRFAANGLPGDCNSRTSCELYCTKHLSECGITAPPGVNVNAAVAACQSKGIPLEQCGTYCISNPAACGITIPSPPHPTPQAQH